MPVIGARHLSARIVASYRLTASLTALSLALCLAPVARASDGGIGGNNNGGNGGAGNGGGGGGAAGNAGVGNNNGHAGSNGNGGAGGPSNYGALGFPGAGGPVGATSVMGSSVTGGGGQNGFADPGISFGGGGAGGGGDGVFTLDTVITVAQNVAITGGQGGVGGTPNRIAGGGGGGGAGLSAVATGATIGNAGTLRGGNGGLGGEGQFGGGGGGGGDGFRMLADGGTMTNSGSITGGNGGGSGPGQFLGGQGGGGAGISVAGNNATIVNSGTIAGGLSGNGGTRAEAVILYGASNILELQAGSTIIGRMVALGGNNSLVLGGDVTDNTTTLDAASYSGFAMHRKAGSSSWVLSGSTSQTTPWQLTGGMLSIASDASLGASAGTLTFDGGTLRTTAALSSARAVGVTSNGGTLQADNDLLLSGTLSGPGNLTKTGVGTLTLTGVSANSGAITVASGTMRVDGTLGNGPVTVGYGARLSGVGTIGGAVTIADGGAIAPGNSPGTLTTGALTLSSGSRLDFELGQPGVVGAGVNDLINVNGNLVLAGTLNITDAGGFGAGVYRLINYTGSLTDNGLALGALPVGSGAGSLFVQTRLAGQVNLINSAGKVLGFWDGGDPALHDDGSISGGNGVWNAANRNWTGANGALNGAWGQDFAVFAGAAGTVQVDNSAGPVRFSGVQFMTDGYVITGDTLTATAAQTVLRTDPGVTATIAAAITGAGAIVKSDQGTLVLSGTNDYAGGTIVRGGILSVSRDASLGAATGAVTLDGGTLLASASFDTARPVLLNSSGAIDVAGGNALGLNGVISGSGDLVKRGAGTLTLGGANIYTGNTSVEAGMLVGADSSIRGNASIADGALLRFVQPGGARYDGILSGTGTVEITGGGSLEFSAGSGGFAGLVAVRQSRLIATGVLGGALLVDRGSVVSGTGTLGQTMIAAGGTIAPGNSIGTLTVNGDITFAPGSFYKVEVDPAGSGSDRIAVSGRAILNGGTVLHVGTAGNYRPQSTYTILTAAGGVVGRFDNVASDFAFLDPTLGYGDNAVTLRLVRNDIDFADVAGTRNQRAAGSAAQALGSGNAIFDAILILNGPDARASFDRLSGEIYPSLKSMLVTDSRLVRSAALDRMRLAGSEADAEPGPRFWMRGFGNWGRIAGDGNAHRMAHWSGGALMGLDAIAGERAELGVFGGWQRSDAHVRTVGSDAAFDSYHVGLYAGVDSGPFTLRTGYAFSWHDGKVTRQINFAGFSDTTSASYRASTMQGFGELGYRLRFASGRIEPFANVAHVSVDTETLSEHGGTAALRIAHGDMVTTFSTIGARVDQTFDLGGMRAALRASAGWRHAFGDRLPLSRMAFADRQPFEIAGVPIAKDALSADLGLNLAVSKRLQFDLSYSGEAARSARDHAARATLSWLF